MCVVGTVCSEGWDLCGYSSGKKPHSHSYEEVSLVCVCMCVCIVYTACVCARVYV